MRSVRTAPRNNLAELVRTGDEIAVHPMPAKHTRDQACDCPTPARTTAQRHCATRFVPARGLTFVEHNVASVVWVRVLDEPHPTVHENPWFTAPELMLLVVPLLGDQIGNPVRFLAHPRDPMVTRERIRLEEGQPEPPVGITSEVAPADGHGFDTITFPPNTPQLSLVKPLPRRTRNSITDATIRLPVSRIPVGVQGVEVGGVHPHYVESHRESKAVDFHSARDSDDCNDDSDALTLHRINSAVGSED